MSHTYSPYRISTITAVGSIGTAIDLDTLYGNLELSSSRFLSVEYTNSSASKCHRSYEGQTLDDKTGDAKKKKNKKKRGKRGDEDEDEEYKKSEEEDEKTPTTKRWNDSRHFDNQVTVIIRTPLLHYDTGFDRTESFTTTTTATSAKKKDKLEAEAEERTNEQRPKDVACPSVLPPAPLPSSSVIVASREDVLHTNLNVKLFRNGNLQITGVKCIEQGSLCIDLLIHEIRRIHDSLRQDGNEGVFLHDASALKNVSYRVCLINSDHNSGIPLNREKLYTVLLRDHAVMCSFEPCIYPGVKIQFSWNAHNPVQDGVCRCTGCGAVGRGRSRSRNINSSNSSNSGSSSKMSTDNNSLHRCDGKGSGAGEGDCRRLTVAIFRSGCIIITGAHTYAQLDDAYYFVKTLLESNLDFIRNTVVDGRPYSTPTLTSTSTSTASPSVCGALTSKTSKKTYLRRVITSEDT